MIEVSTEPLLRAVAAEQFIDQILEVLSNHRTVMDDVLGLNEVEAVVQRGSCKLHAHLTKLLQRAITTLIAILQATDLVIGLLQTLDRDTDTDLRELFAQVNDTVGEETVRGNNDTVRLLVQFTHDILQVSTDERFTAGDVCEVHLWQLLNGLDADFLFRLGRCLITVAHRATSVTTISNDDRTI